ncbi:hypothetical protein [Actinophytocola sp.]
MAGPGTSSQIHSGSGSWSVVSQSSAHTVMPTLSTLNQATVT